MANQQDWNQQQPLDKDPTEPKKQNAGNFKNDPERAAREGRKGGEKSRRS